MDINTNLIYCGDCKEVLKRVIPDNSIDLIYLDPPFFSNKNYEVIWGNGAELRSFEDRWKGGIQHYIGWMKERLEQCYRTLKDTGAMYVHCDYRASHYLRVALDEIFGGYSVDINQPGFKNEIIWCFSIGGRSKQIFPRKHHSILFYTKSGKYNFNGDKIKVSRKPNSHMKVVEVNGVFFQEKIEKRTGKVYRYPLEKTPEDYWTDIEQLNREDKERVGYPTQKPSKLLERIIEASSNRDDIVLDPFCGCGTTLAAAHKLNRQWIGIDVSPVACKVIKTRMENLEGIVEVNIIGGPVSLEELVQYSDAKFQEWACERVGGKSKKKKVSDKGIDGYTREMLPISVKKSEGVGRNVVDNFETAIRRDKKDKGIIVAYSFTKGAYEEAARAKNEGLNITLKTVDELIKED